MEEQFSEKSSKVEPINKNDEIEVLRYEDSDIDPKILRAVAEMGFEQMTPIQAQAIPILLEGRDIIGQAQTGTGKTAAFGIPVIQRIDPENRKLQAIILCPTRELAIQAAEEMRRFAKFLPGVKILPIYGGQDITKQIRSLKSDVQIVVGTPGRVMDHMRRHTMKLDDVKTVVLDEADEMLNMGFKEDIETILQDIPEEHQMALFSATMPKAILDITKNYQRNAVLVKMTHKELTIPLVKQYYYEVKGKNKEEVVSRLLDYYNPKLTLIFANTKRMVDELSENLKGRGYFAEGLHGDMSQNQRDMVMNRFRSGNVEILIATDVAARGIDVEDVEAVFNYDIPQDIEYYVHRIGRTGRAGRKGRAFTLVVGREIYKIREIENTCKTKVKARSIPSAADITAVKAQKVLTQVMDILRDSDLSSMTKLIEQKMDDDDCTAMEMAAAFLKLHMGEAIQDIPVEEYTPRKTYGAYGQTRSGDGRGRSDGRSGSGSGGQRRDGRGSREGGYSRDSRGSKEGGYSSDRKPYSRDSKPSYSRDSKPSFHKEGEKTPYSRDSKPSFHKEGEKSSYSRDSKPSFHKEGEKTIYPRDSKPSSYSRDSKPSSYKDGEKSSYSRDSKPSVYKDSDKPAKKKSIVKDTNYFKGKKPKSKDSAPQD